MTLKQSRLPAVAVVVAVLFCLVCSARASDADAAADSGVEEEFVATTVHGKVRGTVRFALGSSKPVYSYFGIPYARSPDYAFRFRPPIDPWSWKGIVDATDENVPLCRQDTEKLARTRQNTIKQFFFAEDVPMKEDCLTVNVFTPMRPGSKKDAKLPVMMWIHGGSLQTSSTPHQLWMLPSYEDVILVTVQYRLGPFGFMNLNDDTAVGNIGLRDQVKALQWIRDNINSFGGDENLVTIIGQSAGGFSTSALQLSPYASGLFHRVISMSGVAVKPSMWGKHQSRATLSISEDLNCKLWKNGLTMTCMRNRITSSQLINATRSNGHMYLAQNDEDFFPQPADDLLSNHKFNAKIPLMLGGVAGEYDFLLGRKRIPGYETGDVFTRELTKKLMEDEMRKYLSNEKSSQQQQLIERYLVNSETFERCLLDFLSDFHFHSQIHKTAESHRDAGGHVFMYNFAHQPSFYDNEQLRKLIQRPHNFNRADHSDDIAFFLGLPFLPGLSDHGVTFTDEEKQLSQRLMHTIVTFAQTGKPDFGSYGDSDNKLTWNEFPSHISINNSTVHAHTRPYRMAEMQLWKKLFNENKIK